MRRSGLTLVEVLVSMAILGVLSALVIQVTVSSANARRHSDVHEIAYRNTMLGLEHLARYLRGARVQLSEGDGAVAELVIDQPTLDQDRLVVSSTGEPTFDQSVTLRQTGRWLVAVDTAGNERSLADLGDGSVTFQMVGPKLLQIALTSSFTGEQGKRGDYSTQRRFYLNNQ